MMPLRLVFFGPPGSGKGTQAIAISEHYAVPHISVGDMLRDEMKRETPIGRTAKSLINDGNFVPDDIIVKMLEPSVSAKDGFILDGFPRTMPQAYAFDRMLRSLRVVVDGYVSFSIDDDLLAERICGRWSNPRTGRMYHERFAPPRTPGVDDHDGGPLVQRADDRPEMVEKRLSVYRELTAPVVEHYRDDPRFIELDASERVDLVRSRLNEFVRSVQLERGDRQQAL